MKNLFIMLSLVLSLCSSLSHAEPIRYFGQMDNAYQSTHPYGYNAKAGHFIDVGDSQIYYEVYGKGLPVVVLHGGIVGSTIEMGEFIDNLAKNHLVIAVSTRGHGQSKLGNNPSYPQKADDLNQVLAKTTDKAVDIIGFSDGAYTGYFFAQQYPTKVKRLVAIGAGEWIKGARTFNLTLADLVKIDPNYWQQQIRLRNTTETILDQNLATMNAYYSDLELDKTFFAKITTPTLLIVGEYDQNAPLDTVISAYKAMPNAHLSVIPDTNHPAFNENFPAVWSVVEPFLNK